ncbi:M24 family metallopeptidase [Sphingomonas jeddahensis]|uniref:Metallopeptidase family M24 n=1 Tax=Sphingomonas jeddahensis TaxID=1915074 RepID=A0A1V2ER09_9SPHN|nr:M24 family metallopeptidase [Sphingomonas jeddahensis]ONF95030.1 Metallopeptidase family M24 [Sphingomonas jeddahensis]
MRWLAGVAAFGLLGAAPAPAVDQAETLSPLAPTVLPLREQARIRDAWLRERLDTLVPRLMREAGVDMWILVAREYAEDPVLATMLDAESFHARRRTILVFHDPGAGRPVERLTVSRYGLANLFPSAWNPDEEPDQWKRLGQIVAARRPKRIAINISPDSAFADGLTKSQYDELRTALSDNAKRLVPADRLAIGWLETRTPAEMARYPEIVRIAHAIIAQGFSTHAVTPGRTTADDLVWWYREAIAGLRLATWFQPSVAIFRRGAGELGGNEVIRPGDMLWVDFGITYLGLNTDTQHLAYVLRPGERGAPEGLRAGMAAANGVQDAVTAAFRTGRTGNQILVAAREAAIARGLKPTIYSHPIGFHGHAAGSAIGFWDDQQPSPRGMHALRPMTAWSIELSAAHAVPEWDGQVVPFRLEEDAWFDGIGVRYLDGRQTRFHLIRAAARKKRGR